MAWRLLMVMGVLLAATVCHADPSSTPWEVTIGAAHVMTFQTERIPYATYFYAYSVADRPDDIFVSPADSGGRSYPQARWRPSGLPLDAYVFVLDLKSGKVGFLAWERFLRLKTIEERFDRPRPDAYPNLNCGGTMVGYSNMVSIWHHGQTFMAAVSFDSKLKEKTTFGLPSIIPFMGRQHVVEKETYYSGTVFLDIFQKDGPPSPAVQLTKRLYNFPSYPSFGDLALWVQGAARPILVIVEKNDARSGKKGKFLVIRPPT
ncbi:MAG: hypothetical protein ABIL58_27835 [Pseudomonadota bacterium]